MQIAITGISCVEIEDINKTLAELDEIKGEVVFQIFDSDKVAGWRHLYYSAVNALNAAKIGSTISNKIEIEALLYASAQDQISKAIEIMGVTSTTRKLALLVIAESPEITAISIVQHLGKEDESVLELDEGKFCNLKEAYGISDKALEIFEGNKYNVLESLIIEKCALMPLLR
jgi:tRNA threonylcarbamoyladenosine modification (KEOPS) complex Cgi121 subunit